jgi:hypothetical protein
VLASFVVALLNVLRLASLPENARRITETAYTWMSVGTFASMCRSCSISFPP